MKLWDLTKECLEWWWWKKMIKDLMGANVKNGRLTDVFIIYIATAFCSRKLSQFSIAPECSRNEQQEQLKK